MCSAAKLIQTCQYTTEFAGSLPKRRGSGFGFRVARQFLTRCSTKPGIGSDNVTSRNPGIELDPNSSTAEGTSGSSCLEDRALPSKYNSKGLVFGLGSDSSWDSAEIGSPVVKRYVGDDEERWYMWYYGRSDAHDSVGLATSSNGICWARGEERVASSGDVGKVVSCSSDWWAFDTRSVRPSDMVIMSSPMYSAVYWMYYTGYTEEEVLVNKGGDRLNYKSLPGLACSQDGRNWARIEGDHHSGALLDVGIGTQWDSLFIASPNVVLHSDNDLRMYYHSYDAGKGEFGVGLARSRDGIRWVKLGKIMGSSGRQGSFDELGVVNAHVVRQAKQGRYLMAYEGVSGCGKRSIGVAVSEDGLINWTRLQDEPVLQPLEDNEWDNVAVSSPCLVQMEDDEWRLYYKGVGHRGTTGIGMAVSTGTDFTQFRRWQRFYL